MLMFDLEIADFVVEDASPLSLENPPMPSIEPPPPDMATLVLLAEYSALLLMSEVVMVAVVRVFFGDVVTAKVLVWKTV